MEKLRMLFEYQRFAPNGRLQAKLDAVGAKYFASGEALADDELDVAAAGELYRHLTAGRDRMLTSDSAREALYTRYYDRVLGYMLRHARSRADAEDITSEVFLKLLSGADEFDLERVGATSYVFRVMQTVLADHYRRERLFCVSLDEVGETLGTEPDEQLATLDRALETLPQREQEIVMLHYYYGLSHKEIAGRMRLSYGNVRQLCHTALVRLRREMAESPAERG